jgi:hypothetical protein
MSPGPWCGQQPATSHNGQVNLAGPPLPPRRQSASVGDRGEPARPDPAEDVPDLNDLHAILDRYSDRETAQIRRILASRRAA